MNQRGAFLILFWIALLLALLPLGVRTDWVGRNDLQSDFIIVEGQTGRPVPSALLEFRAEDCGFCNEDRVASRYTLTADRSGRLTRKWTSCMCYGTKGLIHDTYYIYLPQLWFRASASGYLASDWTYLDDPIHQRAVKRGDGHATMVVTVVLRKSE